MELASRRPQLCDKFVMLHDVRKPKVFRMIYGSVHPFGNVVTLLASTWHHPTCGYAGENGSCLPQQLNELIDETRHFRKYWEPDFSLEADTINLQSWCGP